jgi:hypothetical protein
MKIIQETMTDKNLIPNQNDIREKVSRQLAMEILAKPDWEVIQREMFAQKLDYLFSLPEEERLKNLGGLSAIDPTSTLITPKGWADNAVKRELVDQIRKLITPKQVEDYLAKKAFDSQTKEDEKTLSSYDKIAYKLGIKLTEDERSRLLGFDRWLSSVSNSEIVNIGELKSILVKGIRGEEPITPFFIKCLRFAYPSGSPIIIPSQEDYVFTDKNGETKTRSGRKDQLWFEQTAATLGTLKSFGFKVNGLIVVADTDLSQVRVLPENSIASENARSYIQEIKRRNPDLNIITFSELARERGLEERYFDIFYSAAANLLTAGSNDPAYSRGWFYTATEEYGLDNNFRQTLELAAEKNRQTGFDLRISPLTFSIAVTEEEKSQSRSLDQKYCSNSRFVVYTALRIARDVAQVGLLIPESGPNSFYISDRSQKAVDFGFLGCRVLRRPPPPTLFQKYVGE